ncbi:hypothetical protein pb186bvf_002776 [Paramecium bursaria]
MGCVQLTTAKITLPNVNTNSQYSEYQRILITKMILILNLLITQQHSKIICFKKWSIPGQKDPQARINKFSLTNHKIRVNQLLVRQMLKNIEILNISNPEQSKLFKFYDKSQSHDTILGQETFH